MDNQYQKGYVTCLYNIIFLLLILNIFSTTVIVYFIKEVVEINNTKPYESTYSKIETIKEQTPPINKSQPPVVIQPIKESTPVQKVAPQLKNEPKFTNKDLHLLARIINAEAGNEPYNGMIAVGNVVMNRVASPDFPNTIRGVIYQKGQFSPVTDGAINKTPNEESIRAAKEVINGARVVGKDILFFHNPKISRSNWMSKRRVVTKIGGHVFTK